MIPTLLKKLTGAERNVVCANQSNVIDQRIIIVSFMHNNAVTIYSLSVSGFKTTIDASDK